MAVDKNRARSAGLLILFGIFAGILSIAPAIDAPDFLSKASANANQVMMSAVFQFMMIPLYAGVAIVLFPILKQHSETLALGFLSFRLIAAGCMVIGIIFLLLILWVSQEFTKTAIPDRTYFQTLGDLLRAGRDLVNHVLMVWSLGIAGLIFYFALFRARLVPRWLSIGGLLGTLLTIFASLLVLLHVAEIITPLYLVLNLPAAALEIILATWLIAKGLDSSQARGELQG